MNRVLIQNGLIMAAMLTAVFLSQQTYFQGVSKTFTFPLVEKATGYFDDSPLKKVGNLFKASTYSDIGNSVGNIGNNIGQETSKRGEDAKEELTIQKNNLEKNSISAAKKFMAEKILNIIGVTPEDLQTSQQSSEQCE